MPILGIFKLNALNENSRGFRRGGYDEKYDDAREVWNFIPWHMTV